MKKVLSVLVAFMLLFSICSIAASAAINDAAMALKVTANGDSFTPGQEVLFELTYEAIPDVGPVGVCEVTIGYDSDVFELVDTIPAGGMVTFTAAQTDVLEGYAFDGQISGDNSKFMQRGSLTDADRAKGWDSTLFISVTKDTNFVMFDATSEVKVMAFKLKVKDTAAGGNYTVGITQASVDDYSTSVDALYEGQSDPIKGPSGPDYGFATTKIFDCVDAAVVVAGGVTPPPVQDPVEVKNISAQVQWQDKDAGLMKVAFRGNILNYTVNLKDGSNDILADINGVGVMFSKSNTNPTVGGDYCTAVPAATIYDFTNGGYFFRAIVEEVGYDNTVKLYARPYIILNDDIIVASDVISTSGAEEYARATTLPNNPMPTK